jgi:hypothetical protein
VADIGPLLNKDWERYGIGECESCSRNLGHKTTVMEGTPDFESVHFLPSVANAIADCSVNRASKSRREIRTRKMDTCLESRFWAWLRADTDRTCHFFCSGAKAVVRSVSIAMPQPTSNSLAVDHAANIQLCGSLRAPGQRNCSN